MSRLKNWWRCLLRVLHQRYVGLGQSALLLLLLVAGLEYGFVAHGCDLLWWRSLVLQEEITPLTVLLNIAGAKIVIILGITLFSYTRKATNDQQERRKEEMPISYVRRRYCQFVVMRLLAALDALLHHPPEDYLQAHASFCQAVELFRWDARKLFERDDQQLCLPLYQVLSVVDLQEEQLLQLGYGEGLLHLRELDIYRMVFDTSA
ncbi:hypothetical protein KR009_003576 [Drosophila setifemur]|nr:hypothetical protein KR009_003576 [Drosophila setifemur]